MKHIDSILSAKKSQHLLLVAWAISVLIAAPLSGWAQDPTVRDQIFGETDQLLKQATDLGADLYSPKNFGKAMQHYEDAERRFERGGNLNDIRKRLNSAMESLRQAMEGSKLAAVAFTDVMAARNAAIKANAADFDAENWGKGEKIFTEAAGKLEDGKANDANKKGTEAVGYYRAAELAAIKTKFLLPAWDLLEEAKQMDAKNHAPITLEKATNLAQQVESLLNQNRYDTDEALQLAEEGKYEAAHAIYLAQKIMQLKKSKDYESLLLESEIPLRRIGSALEMKLDFTNGVDVPGDRIVRSINTLVDKIRKDQTAIAQKNSEIKALEQQVATMQERLGSASEAEKELQASLEKMREEKEKMDRIGEMFSTEEAIVLRSGSNIIIRLYGVTFPVGRSTIEPQYFELLSRVMRAFDEFPDAQIIIEGHTDSRGSDELNLKLSQDRSQAVAQYFTAIDAGLIGKIQSEGYGESRPIASNDTVEGRTRNRRIDIVINPR
jgi:outer membrane protein OmpA-like peptidoglycan-associated protein